MAEKGQQPSLQEIQRVVHEDRFNEQQEKVVRVVDGGIETAQNVPNFAYKLNTGIPLRTKGK